MVYQHDDKNNRSVEEAVNDGLIQLDDVLPTNLLNREIDAHGMITRRGGSAEDYDGRRGPSRVMRREEDIAVKPYFKKPNYLVRMPIQDWFYHPAVPGIERVFKLGDNVVELDITTTLTFLNILGLPEERRIQIRSGLEAEVSEISARDPSNPNAEAVFKNIGILNDFYERHQAKQPLLPGTVYQLKKEEKKEEVPDLLQT